MLRRALIWITAIGLFVSQGAPAETQAQESDQPLNVVTSFSILDDLVRQVGGEAIVTHPLVGAGADSHTYEPAPADVVTLAEADLVFEIGLGFETWLDGIYESSGSDAARIIVSEQVEPLGFDDGHHEAEARDEEAADDLDDAAGDDQEDHAHGELDPHIWHDVANAILMVETIRDALIETDPANAATYEANAAAYITELEALDAWVQEQVNSLAEDQRTMVTSHEALGYYAERYGLEIVGTAFGTLGTEAGDPSAADIADLVAAIRAENVNAIFAENVSNPAVMESIAAEAGVTLVPTLYTDSLGAPGSGVETYVDLMRANTTGIVTALAGSES
ncbi:MAG: zinc ABC transporter substrate-binding protein [Chloroflexota bacterium]|nr:zinc ABC transporter substrate-binding protein [Chloroflexota bacterium]